MSSASISLFAYTQCSRVMMDGNANSLLAWFCWQCDTTIIYQSWTHDWTALRKPSPLICVHWNYRMGETEALGNEWRQRWWITSDWRKKIITFFFSLSFASSVPASLWVVRFVLVHKCFVFTFGSSLWVRCIKIALFFRPFFFFSC